MLGVWPVPVLAAKALARKRAETIDVGTDTLADTCTYGYGTSKETGRKDSAWD